jgi:hypothetical protein
MRSIAILTGMVTALLITLVALSFAWHFEHVADEAAIEARQAHAARQTAEAEVTQAMGEIEVAKSNADAAVIQAKQSAVAVQKAKEDASKAKADALEVGRDRDAVRQLAWQSGALAGYGGGDPAALAEAEIQQSSATGEFWLQIATDNTLKQSRASLRVSKKRLVAHDPNVQFMILERRGYYVLMVGPYATAEAAKDAWAHEELYPYGRYIRSLDSFCPGRVPLESPDSVAVNACQGVVPMERN